MKRNMIYAIVIVLVIVLCVGAIIITKNKTSENGQVGTSDQSSNNIPNKNEANNMTDDQLIEKTTLGEEKLNLDNIEDDTILTNIDTVLSEKDPLADMPGE